MIIYYGNNSKDIALEYIKLNGKLLLVFGEDGLKSEESREIVKILMDPPFCRGVQYLLIGPLDRANPLSFDPLLKIIEEPINKNIFPIFWAKDLAPIPNTIKSRCKLIWCYKKEEILSEDANKVLELIHSNYLSEAINLLQKHSDNIEDFIFDIISVISTNEIYLYLWPKIKSILTHDKPSSTELISVLI